MEQRKSFYGKRGSKTIANRRNNSNASFRKDRVTEGRDEFRKSNLIYKLEKELERKENVIQQMQQGGRNYSSQNKNNDKFRKNKNVTPGEKPKKTKPKNKARRDYDRMEERKKDAFAKELPQPQSLIAKGTHHIEWGGKPVLDHGTLAGEAVIEVEVVPSSYMLIHTCALIVLNMVAVAGYKADQEIKANWIVRFLTDYLNDEWRGKYHQYPIVAAPVLFIDLMAAGRPKKIGRYNYHMKEVTLSWDNEFTIANYGFMLGKVTGSSSNYMLIDTTWGTYDEKQAAEFFKDLCGMCGDQLGVVSVDAYKSEITEDDNSFFAWSSGIVSGIRNTYRELINTAVYQAFRMCHLGHKPKCEWLARLSCNDSYFAVGMEHAVERKGGRAGLIHLRMQKRWKGYEYHTVDVIPVFVDGNMIAAATENLMGQVEIISGTTPWSTAISFDDFKVIVANFIFRWCSGWVVGGAGMFNYDSVNTRNLFCVGSGTGYHISYPQLVFKNFQVIEDALSRIFPTNNADGDVLLPLPIFSSNYTALGGTNAVLYLAQGSGVFQAAWNWVTGLLTVGGQKVSINNVSYQGGMGAVAVKWNTVMESVQAQAPVSVRKDEKGICVTRCVWAGTWDILASGGDFLGYAQCKGSRIPDHLLEVMSRSICPFVDMSTQSEQRVNEVAQLLKLPNVTYTGTIMKVIDVLVASMLSTLHKTAGVGDQSGLVDRNEEEEEDEGASGFQMVGRDRGGNSVTDALKAVKTALEVANALAK